MALKLKTSILLIFLAVLIGVNFDALTTIFGVMQLGNIEKNPIVHQLIATFGLKALLLWVPVETALYAIPPIVLILIIRKSKLDWMERSVVALGVILTVAFPYLVAVINFLFVLQQTKTEYLEVILLSFFLLVGFVFGGIGGVFLRRNGPLEMINLLRKILRIQREEPSK